MHSCKACEARDLTIAALKEMISNQNDVIKLKDAIIEQHAQHQQEMIDYFSGKARIQQAANSVGQSLHSIPRNQGIQSRIRRAEQHDAAEAIQINAQRKREYEDRIRQMERPEIEVMNDGK
jgi:hypothetical protein